MCLSYGLSRHSSRGRHRCCSRDCPLTEDILHTLRGVGGTEVVFTRRLDSLQIGEHRLTNFEIEVGGMDYGFEMHGILGMDFLIQAGAIINLHEMTITFAN